MADLGLFLRQLLRAPREISAPVPSSRFLAREMVRGIGPDERVIELGPGTGVFTAALLAAGVSPKQMVLVERQAAFRDLLARRYPGIMLLTDAADLSGLPWPLADRVISGLPLLSFPLDVQRRILGQVFLVLKEGGSLVQFTYGRAPSVSPVLIAEMGLEFTRSARIWRNLPPACVYRYRRRTTGIVDMRSG